MKDLVNDLGHYLCLAVLSYYTYRFFIRWEELHRLSVGHKILGLLSFVTDVVLILVVTMAPKDSAYSSFFVLLAVAFTGVWLHYNSWYAKRIQPAIDRFYSDPNRGPDTEDAGRLERYLLGVDPVPAPIFNQHNKTWMAQVAFVLLGVIGFVWIVNVRADGDKRLAAVQLKVAKEKSASDDSIKNFVTDAVSSVADTITNGQKAIMGEVKGSKSLVLNVVKEQKDVKAELKKRQSKPTRPQLLIINTTPKTTRFPQGPGINREIKSPEPVSKPSRKRGRIGYDYQPDSLLTAPDSLPYWVRSTNY